MTDVSFKYPTREVNTLNNISVQVSMASRVAVIGVNGAGKSTMIKLMVGELEPNEEGAAKNYLELTEEEEQFINQKQGQVQCLRGRRKGKMGNDALLKMTYVDPADKKRTEHSLASAMEKLMM